MRSTWIWTRTPESGLGRGGREALQQGQCSLRGGDLPAVQALAELASNARSSSAMPRTCTRPSCAPGWSRCPTPTSPPSGNAATCSPITAPPPKWTSPTAGSRWCWTAWVCSSSWMVCTPWGSRPSISHGPRRMTPTAPRIGGGHRWRRPMRRCSSGATPRFCAGWTCYAACASTGVESPFRHPRTVGGREVVVSAGRAAAAAAPGRPHVPAPAYRAPRARGAHRRTWPRPRHPPAARQTWASPSRCWAQIKSACRPRACGAAARLAGAGPPGRPRPAAGCARRAARTHAGAAGGSGRGTVQRRRRTRGPALPGVADLVGRA